MIKIKLTGTKEELSGMLAAMDKNAGVRLVSVSRPYPCSGADESLCINVDAQLKEDLN